NDRCGTAGANPQSRVYGFRARRGAAPRNDVARVIMSFDFHPLWDWFRVLHETTGIKLTIFYDAFDRARFFNGCLTSVRLMAVCLVASVAIGVVGAWIQGSRLRVLRLTTQGYIQFFRNTPPLVQLY